MSRPNAPDRFHEKRARYILRGDRGERDSRGADNILDDNESKDTGTGTGKGTGTGTGTGAVGEAGGGEVENRKAVVCNENNKSDSHLADSEKGSLEDSAHSLGDGEVASLSAVDIQGGIATIRDIAQRLPSRAGVYRMIDRRGDVLYVGKARALKNRVTSYTQLARLPTRLKRMVAQTRSMEIVTTNSEAEALLLEAQLIKHFRPPYNVLLRDDKSFPFILLRSDHDFPRIQRHRGARKIKGRYYGPFASAPAVRRTLNALQKIFLLRSCSDSFFANRSRPCLLYQIKRCSAPCVGRIDQDSYAQLVAQAREFLEGQSVAVQKQLAAAMGEASERLDYEQAALYRDRLQALTFIQGSQAVNARQLSDADIFAIACGGGQACIAGFFIRSGQNWGHRSFFPSHTAGRTPEEILVAFLTQFYEGMTPPRLILLDRKLEDSTVVAEALGSLVDYKVMISNPQRGQRRRLIAQATRNAREELERKLAQSATQAKLGAAMAELFDLPAPPQRIEIYDNSHIQGSNAVGAMVVAGPDGWLKKAYRKFTIKDADTVAGDDFAMMREVLRRRFARALAYNADSKNPNSISSASSSDSLRSDSKNPESENAGDTSADTSAIWPDLVLIDGGKGQVAAMGEVLAELGIEDVTYVGVAKGVDRNAGRETLYFPDGREVNLPTSDPVLFYIQRLRDEAHRFAIGAHRQKRKRALQSSPLDSVPQIGPARKRALLLHFGTARAVRDASLEDLQRTPGINKTVAQSLYDYFHT